VALCWWRKNVDYLSSAHKSYLEGLKKQGFPIDELFPYYAWTEFVKEIGWARRKPRWFYSSPAPRARPAPPAHRPLYEFSTLQCIGHSVWIRRTIGNSDEVHSAPGYTYTKGRYAPIIANAGICEYCGGSENLGPKLFPVQKITNCMRRKAFVYYKRSEATSSGVYWLWPKRKIEDLPDNMGGPSEMHLFEPNIGGISVE